MCAMTLGGRAGTGIETTRPNYQAKFQCLGWARMRAASFANIGHVTTDARRREGYCEM